MTDRPHVLFVDDEPAMLSGLRRMLRAQRDRWDMSFAVGGEEAMAILTSKQCDVVVSDFRMPGMDGAALLQNVRDHHPEAARIILSGHTDETDLLKVILLAHQFVNKPCTGDDIIAAVERVLALRATFSNADVRREVTGIEFLPSPPSTLRDLLAALESNDVSPRSVAQTLERDPAATAKILQVVNSASAGTSRRISDITQAVSLLGLRNVRALVLMHDLVHDFHPTTIAGVDWVGHLAGHSVETSRLARLLSDGAPWADDAFAGGLLLDIGQLVLAWCRPDAFSQHYLAWHHREGALADIEARTFGVDHAAAGAYLLSLWGLSFNVIQAAAEHARSTAPPDLTGPVGAVIAAHRIVEAELGPVCGPRDGGPPVDEEQFDPAIRKRLARWRADLHREGTEPVDD